MIFVFGSNQAGRHGKGAALDARRNHGARYGQGEGLQGNSYAIPTKDRNLRTRSLSDIGASVRKFLDFARSNPDMRFHVTALGTGLAGYSAAQVGPMFAEAPSNCELCDDFKTYRTDITKAGKC